MVSDIDRTASCQRDARSRLQHRAAKHEARIGGGAKAAGKAFGGLVMRPPWLAGLAADAAGSGLHAYALSAGQLAIVQPLLATTLHFALGRTPACAL